MAQGANEALGESQARGCSKRQAKEKAKPGPCSPWETWQVYSSSKRQARRRQCAGSRRRRSPSRPISVSCVAALCATLAPCIACGQHLWRWLCGLSTVVRCTSRTVSHPRAVLHHRRPLWKFSADRAIIYATRCRGLGRAGPTGVGLRSRFAAASKTRAVDRRTRSSVRMPLLRMRTHVRA